MHGMSRYALALVVLVGAAPSAAADPAEMYKELFGAEAAKVSRTPSKADDGEFAGKLLQAAGTLTEAPELRVYIYEKACHFGLEAPTGYKHAERALSALGAAAPDRQNEWDELALKLRRLAYRDAQGPAKRTTGEALIGQLLRVGEARAGGGKWSEALDLYKQALTTATYIRSPRKDKIIEKVNLAEEMKEVETLQRRVEADPDNAVLRAALIRMLLGMGKPGLAAKHVSPALDEVYRTYVPLAAKPIEGLPTQVCLELGNWYSSLASSAGPTTKATFALRSKEYFAAYLRRAQADGIDAEQLNRQRERINARLRELGAGKLLGDAALGGPEVQEALRKAVKYLWSQQAGDGSWQLYSSSSSSLSMGYYNTRPTAAALTALLHSGAEGSDARVVKALRWLSTHNTPQTEGMAVRCQAWGLAHRHRGASYMRRLGKDVAALIRGTRNGGYGSTVTSTYSSYPYCSWYAPIGVAVGDRQGMKVPSKYWLLVMKYWTGLQKGDGSWGSAYGSSSSRRGSSTLWTVMGTGTVALCLERLHGRNVTASMSGPAFEPLRRGMDWLDENLTAVTRLKDGGYSTSSSYSYSTTYATHYEGLYVLSRLGRITGRKTIGKLEWPKAGADYLVSTQAANGSWSGTLGTSRALMFLANVRKFNEKVLFGEDGPPAGGGEDAAPPAAGGDDREDPARRIARRKIETMKKRLAEKPDSEDIARELVRLYAVELQSPARAMEYAGKTGQPDTAEMLKLAGKSVLLLKEDECLALAGWYAEQAEGSSIAGRKHALSRAETCYRRFLAQHERGDAKKLKAKLGLEKTREALAELEGG